MIEIIGDNTLYVNGYYISIGAVKYYDGVAVPRYNVSKNCLSGELLFESWSFKETINYIEENTHE